jgi:hypothetical protein
MPRARVADGLLNLALAGAGLAVLALLYGLAARTFVPRTDSARAEAPAAPGDGIIQVEVLNGAGAEGIAGATADYLRGLQLGFDVLRQGNHAAAEQTRVLDRVGAPDLAHRVAEALGLPDGRVVTELDPSLDLDVSVVLGADYAALAPFADGHSDR